MSRFFLFLLIVLCVLMGYRVLGGLIQQAFKQSEQRDSFRPHPQGAPSDQALEKRHRAVLGVSQAAGEEEIKAAYRSQLAKYHPDKVTHLGDEFHELASSRTKQIIEAYDYLKHKYAFR